MDACDRFSECADTEVEKMKFFIAFPPIYAAFRSDRLKQPPMTDIEAAMATVAMAVATLTRASFSCLSMLASA